MPFYLSKSLDLLSKINLCLMLLFFIIYRFAFISGLSKFNTEKLIAAGKNFMALFLNDVYSSLLSECLHFRSFILIIAKGQRKIACTE